MNFNWTAIAQAVASGVKALAPIAETLAPEAAPAISIAETIVTGAINLEPTAVALVAQIKAGTPPTPAQLASYLSTYHADDDALSADIAEHLASGSKTA